jgi:hypothetical protein
LGFRKLARKNLARIQQLNDRACLFSFLAWKSYAIVAVMITGGVLLRHSAIPKPYLAIQSEQTGTTQLHGGNRWATRRHPELGRTLGTATGPIGVAP